MVARGCATRSNAANPGKTQRRYNLAGSGVRIHVLRVIALILVSACATTTSPPPGNHAPSPPLAPRPQPAPPDADEVACQGGETWSCVIIGNAYTKGDTEKHLGADAVKAARYLDIACTADIPEGCALLAQVYASGGTGLARDPERAARADARLCTLGYDTHCIHEPPAEPDPFESTDD